MRGETVVELRSGLGAGGREAVIRNPTGVDEALFAHLVASLPPAPATSEILAAVTVRIGTRSPVSADDMRQLTGGDRHRLLIALYRAIHGERLSLVAPCLAPNCGRTMDVDLSLNQLLEEPIRNGMPLVHEMRLALCGRDVVIRFRLPNGDDQEAAGGLAAEDIEGAARLILRRTILSVTSAFSDGDERETCLHALQTPLTAAFARLDPEAELVLRLTCPECGHETPADLDPYALFKSGALHGHDVLADVDRIARSYHWSEADIMALPIARRRRYLALIEDAGAPA